MPGQRSTRLAMGVELVGRDAVKDALSIPRQPRDAVHSPAHADGVVCFLPDAHNLNKEVLEKEAPVEAQGPEDRAIVF